MKNRWGPTDFARFVAVCQLVRSSRYFRLLLFHGWTITYLLRHKAAQNTHNTYYGNGAMIASLPIWCGGYSRFSTRLRGWSLAFGGSGYISDALISILESRAHQVLDHLSYLQSSSRPCTIVSWTIYLCGRPIPSRRNLRSCGTGRLVLPPVHRSTFGGRAFPVAGSQLWNTTVGGDVGAVAGDLPQAEDLLLTYSIIPGHINQSIQINKFITRHSTEARATMSLSQTEKECLSRLITH